MKIIKEFESNAFATKRSPSMTSPDHVPCLTWGLGDDGYIYWKGQLSGYVFMNTWTRGLGFGVPLYEMKKIVKEFGHLLVFM